jgi:hypothetical protein
MKRYAKKKVDQTTQGRYIAEQGNFLPTIGHKSKMNKSVDLKFKRHSKEANIMSARDTAS